MPSIVNANEATKDEIRDLLDDMNMVSTAGSVEHALQWNDQSGQGHGPIACVAAYGDFTTAEFTVAGNTNSSTTITNLVTTGRIVVGMTITGTGIPASTTVASIVSSTSITISQAATATAAGVTFTFGTISATDPVAVFGYNRLPNGAEIVPGRGQAALQIEGHYDLNRTGHAAGDIWMEAFLTFRGPTASGVARPLFFSYDKQLNQTGDVSIAPGVGRALRITNEDVTGAAGVDSYSLSANIMEIRGVTAGQDTQIRFGSVSGQGSNFVMGADGDDPVIYPKFRIRSQSTSTNHTVEFTFYDNNITPTAKTGGLYFIAPTWANTPLMSFGQAGASSHSLVYFNMANAAVNLNCLRLDSIASMTAPMFTVGGINNATPATVETAKFNIYPRGYIAVRESGNTATDRIPSTGASTITPTYTNKPGAGTGGTPTWFPMLSATGALFWVPGFAD